MKIPFSLNKLVKYLSAILILIFGFGNLGIMTASGAESTSISSQTDSLVTISGRITVLWGDGVPGSNISKGPIYMLEEVNLPPVILVISEELAGELGSAEGLAGKRVLVEGNWLHAPDQSSEPATFQAQKIQFQEGIEAASSNAVSGSQPWVSILCKFSDIPAEPNPLSHFVAMYSSFYPGLDHFWREQSYGMINLTGSNAAGWFTLPQVRSYYFYDDGNLNLARLENDCIMAADPTVNFSSFTGINMMFNGDLDCCAWGSSGGEKTLDGVTKSWHLTWIPPVGYQNVTMLEHEMGHGLGLRHTSGMYGETYDNQWDLMSDTWSNCERSTDPIYGCLGQHLMTFHKDILGWIPGQLRFIATPATTPATITLERLAQPQTENYRIAIIPIQNSISHYYTVEVRRRTGYDVKLPGQGVIIHEVVGGNLNGSVAFVLDPDNNGNTGDEGAIWRSGETFSDPANQITLTVNSETTSGVNLTINNASQGILFDDNFDTCSLAAWSSSSTDGGDLSSSREAAQAGPCGMQAVIDDNVPIFVTDDSPGAEHQYQAGFGFDPNSIAMLAGDTHTIFGGYAGTSALTLRLQLQRSSTGYQIRASLLNDASTWVDSNWYPIESGYLHNIELDWRAASGVGANDGKLTFRLDNSPAYISEVDNDTQRLDRVRLGAVAGIDSGTRGTYYFDEFQSSNGNTAPVRIYADFEGSPSPGVPPLDVSFTNKSGPPVSISSFLWDFGDGSTSTENNPTHTYTTLGSYTVRLTASGGGQQDTESKIDYIRVVDEIVEPTLTWIAPVGDGQVYDVGNELIQLQVEAADNTGISYVEFRRYDLVDKMYVSLGQVNAPPYRVELNTATLNPDDNFIEARAFDASGNMASKYIFLNHVAAPRDVIFADGFEAGNLSAWSSSAKDGTDLSVRPAAANLGAYGLQALIDDNVSIHVTDDSPEAEASYRASFDFDPNSISMAAGDVNTIFAGYSGTSKMILRLQFQNDPVGDYQIQASLLNDGSVWKNAGWFRLSDAYHRIELVWHAADAPGFGLAGLTLLIDGQKMADMTGPNNVSWRIDRVRLGAVDGIDAGTHGTYYFDEFSSEAGVPAPEPTASLTVNLAGTGKGTVTSDPAGINCGSDCTEVFLLDTRVTLTAAADPGSSFTGWSGGCSGMTCTVTMSANTSVTANFMLIPISENLLENGSFELDANQDSMPDIWSTNAKFTRSNVIAAIDGAYVGRFRAADNTGATIQQQVRNLAAGRSYDFSGMVNIPATTDQFTFTIQVKWRNANSNLISTSVIKRYTSSTVGWNEAAAVLVAPPGTTNAVVQMVVNNLNARIFVDNFSFILR